MQQQNKIKSVKIFNKSTRIPYDVKNYILKKLKKTPRKLVFVGS